MPHFLVSDKPIDADRVAAACGVKRDQVRRWMRHARAVAPNHVETIIDLYGPSAIEEAPSADKLIHPERVLDVSEIDKTDTKLSQKPAQPAKPKTDQPQKNAKKQDTKTGTKKTTNKSAQSTSTKEKTTAKSSPKNDTKSKKKTEKKTPQVTDVAKAKATSAPESVKAKLPNIDNVIKEFEDIKPSQVMPKKAEPAKADAKTSVPENAPETHEVRAKVTEHNKAVEAARERLESVKRTLTQSPQIKATSFAGRAPVKHDTAILKQQLDQLSSDLNKLLHNQHAILSNVDALSRLVTADIDIKTALIETDSGVVETRVTSDATPVDIWANVDIDKLNFPENVMNTRRDDLLRAAILTAADALAGVCDAVSVDFDFAPDAEWNIRFDTADHSVVFVLVEGRCERGIYGHDVNAGANNGSPKLFSRAEELCQRTLTPATPSVAVRNCLVSFSDAHQATVVATTDLAYARYDRFGTMVFDMCRPARILSTATQIGML